MLDNINTKWIKNHERKKKTSQRALKPAFTAGPLLYYKVMACQQQKAIRVNQGKAHQKLT
jgi:hypothetical protein